MFKVHLQPTHTDYFTVLRQIPQLFEQQWSKSIIPPNLINILEFCRFMGFSSIDPNRRGNNPPTNLKTASRQLIYLSVSYRLYFVLAAKFYALPVLSGVPDCETPVGTIRNNRPVKIGQPYIPTSYILVSSFQYVQKALAISLLPTRQNSTDPP